MVVIITIIAVMVVFVVKQYAFTTFVLLMVANFVFAIPYKGD